VLVNRSDARDILGYRSVAVALGPADWRVVRGSSSVSVTPEGSGLAAQVKVDATLVLQAVASTATLALEVPSVAASTLDSGGERFRLDWQLDSVDGGGTTWLLAAVDPDVDHAFRRDSRLAVVTWPAPVAAGDERVVRVQWSQRVPYARLDVAGRFVRRFGTATPPLPALPRPAGDAGRFPYTLEVWGPDDTTVVASGGDEQPLTSEHGRHGVRAQGLAGGAAAAVVGAFEIDRAGSLRALTQRPREGLTASLVGMEAALRSWTGWNPGAVDLVELPPAWMPPAPLTAEGLAGLRGGLGMRGTGTLKIHPWDQLPALSQVLVAESMAGALLAGAAGADAEARVWVAALARAFALDTLAAPDAAAWRLTLQECAAVGSGTRPAWSPAAAGNTGFADLAARCAGPLLVGAMLEDRLGSTGAARVRRAALADGLLRVERLVAAVIDEDPTAAAWAQRWLVEGHMPTASPVITVSPDGGGSWRVHGRIDADMPLADAPITVRLTRGERTFDVVAHGAEPFDMLVPFEPLMSTLDPDHRALIRVAGPLASVPSTTLGRLQ
jgi:hypothetical protein